MPLIQTIRVHHVVKDVLHEGTLAFVPHGSGQVEARLTKHDNTTITVARFTRAESLNMRHVRRAIGPSVKWTLASSI